MFARDPLPPLQRILHLRVHRQSFPGVPLLALTATATEAVQTDILQCLGMRRGLTTVFRTPFRRTNLHFHVKLGYNLWVSREPGMSPEDAPVLPVCLLTRLLHLEASCFCSYVGVT